MRMLEHGVIQYDQIGKCSAVTIDIIKTIKIPFTATSHVLQCALSGGRIDIVECLIDRYEYDYSVLETAMDAAVRAKNDKVFAWVIKKMTNSTALHVLVKCCRRDVIQFPPSLDFVRSVTLAELSACFDQASSNTKDSLICFLAESLGRELCQDMVDLIYQHLCQRHMEWRMRKHVRALMEAGHFPVGVALAECVEKFEGFLERYVLKWPLDRTAVRLALQRQLRADPQHAEFKHAITNFNHLLTHSGRPAWNEILGLIRCNTEVDNDLLWRFVAAVEANYDLSEAESMCSSDDYAVLASKYIPRAASKKFEAQTVLRLLGEDSIAEFEPPEILVQDGESKATIYCVKLTSRRCPIV